MSVRTDVLNLQVNINGDKSKNELNQLRKNAAELNSELKGLKKNTEEYANKKRELSEINAKMASLKQTMGLTALTQKELNNELRKLHALKMNLIPQTKEFFEVEQQIKAVTNRLYEVKTGTFGFGAALSKVKDEVKQFGVMAAAYLGFEFVSDQFKKIISSAGKMSDQLADLRRVSGLNADEADRLNQSLKNLDTRTSTSTLREIAIIAGKMGVAKNDIQSFTQALDMLVVSLGDELGDADQIATQLGKILNVFDGEVTGDKITKLGNAVVELANRGVASAPFITDFTQRVSGIAKASNMSLGSTVGLGAAFEELGLRSESSATALQKLISNIAADIPAAARVAGMDVQAFNNLFAKAPQEALIKYAQGLVQNKQSFAEIAKSFKDAGEEGARVVQTLQVIGQSGDFLAEKLRIGNEAMQETTAISEAFAIKNNTLGGTIDKLGKEFNKIITSSAVNNFLKGLIESTYKLLVNFQKLPDFIAQNKASLTVLISGITLLNLNLIKTIGLQALKILGLKDMSSWIKQVTIAENLAAIATTSWSLITSVLTLNFAKARAEFMLLSVLIKANPLGVLLTVLGAVIVAYEMFTNKVAVANEESKRFLNMQKNIAAEAGKEIAQLDMLYKGATNVALGIDERIESVDKLQAKYPEYFKNIDDEIILTGKAVGVYNQLRDAILQTAMAKSAQNEIDKIAEEKLQSELYITNQIEEKQAKIKELRGNKNPMSDATADVLEQQVKMLEKRLVNAGKAYEGMALKYINIVNKAQTNSLKTPDSNNGQNDIINNPESIKQNNQEAQKAIDDKKEAYERFIKEIQKLDEELRLSQFNGYTLEIEKVRAKYKALYNEYQKYGFDLFRLKEHEALEISKIEKKQKDSIELYTMNYLLNEKEQAILIAKQIYDERLKLHEEFLQKVEDEDEKRFKAQVDNAKKNAGIGTDGEKKDVNFEDTFQQISSIQSDFFSSSYNLMVAYDNLTSLIERNQLDREKKINNEKKDSFDKMLKSKRVSQAEYNQKVKALDDDYNKKKLEIDTKAFRRQQTISYMNAAMNGAEGITKIWATYSAMPWVAALLTAMTLGVVGLQIATIKKQQPPQAERGMLIQGKRHAEGGTLIEAEDGEVILSRNTVKNNPKIVGALLDSSMNNNGKTIGQYLLQKSPTISTSTMMPIMQYGGYVTSSGKPYISSSRNANSTADVTGNTSTNLPISIRAHVVYQDLLDKEDMYNMAKNEGRIKQD